MWGLPLYSCFSASLYKVCCTFLSALFLLWVLSTTMGICFAEVVPGIFSQEADYSTMGTKIHIEGYCNSSKRRVVHLLTVASML